MVKTPRDYTWGSYRATAGYEPAPDWLEVNGVLGQFHKIKKLAREGYRNFVNRGLLGKESPWAALEGQIYLGTKEFLDDVKRKVKKIDPEIPEQQRRVRRVAAEEVLGKVAKVYGLKDTGELLRVRRDGEARRVAMYWLRVEGEEFEEYWGRVLGHPIQRSVIKWAECGEKCVGTSAWRPKSLFAIPRPDPILSFLWFDSPTAIEISLGTR
jgi:hypothetical protein